MRRAEFLAHVSTSERNLRAAANSLAVLRGLLSRLAAVSADASDSRGESDALASTLATLPRLSVLGWKRLCADDPLLAFLIRARAEYRLADERRGKSTKRVQECALSLYRRACELGVHRQSRPVAGIGAFADGRARGEPRCPWALFPDLLPPARLVNRRRGFCLRSLLARNR